jgi:hypothetical protein
LEAEAPVPLEALVPGTCSTCLVTALFIEHYIETITGRHALKPVACSIVNFKKKQQVTFFLQFFSAVFCPQKKSIKHCSEVPFLRYNRDFEQKAPSLTQLFRWLSMREL